MSYTLTAQVKGEIKLPLEERHDLFNKDSIIIYIGIENKFVEDSNKIVQPEREIQGLRIKIKPEYLSIIPIHPGVFNVSFKTSSGSKKVILVAKALEHPKNETFQKEAQ